MEQHPSFIGMGTTIAGVLIRKDHALAFNVGDSRIYLHHGGKLAQISVDHVTSGNLLTQCLGGFVRESRIEPHVTAVPLSPDAQLLLCSDGLTRVLTDEQIASSLGQGGQNAAERLVAAALQGGGHDNISVVLVEILSGS
jgi:protein phosphatase